MTDTLVVFDLDGTLSRSHICILESAKRTLQRLNLPPVEDAYVLTLIGELYDTFFAKLAPGYNDYQLMERVYTDIQREVISQCGELYDGAFDALTELKALGCATALLSNGSLEYEELVTGSVGIKELLDELVSGGDHNGKANALRYIINRFNRQTAVMVGDRRHDIEAAHANNAVAVAALYGYGVEAELDAADYYINEPYEIISVIRRLNSDQ